MNSKERFDIEIRTPVFLINAEGITKEQARQIAEKCLEDNPHDQTLHDMMADCMRSFGFTGSSQGGYSVSISGYIPRQKTGEKQTCPNRMESVGTQEHKEGLDEWELRGDDKCCSYCGSLHPDRVLELIKEKGFGIVEKTDKSYKWYVNRNNVPNAGYGGIKYYRWHDTDEFIEKYNELVTKHKLG